MGRNTRKQVVGGFSVIANPYIWKWLKNDEDEVLKTPMVWPCGKNGKKRRNAKIAHWGWGLLN